MNAPLPHAFLLGLPFAAVTMEETVAWCERAVLDRGCAYLTTANLDFVAQAERDPDLRRILFQSGLNVCDGMPMVWLSRIWGPRLPARVAGSDLVFELFALCARRRWSVFLLGSDEPTLAHCANVLPERYPGLQVAGTFAPPVAPLHAWPSRDISERVRATRPDILMVAVGCPKQERWIHDCAADLRVPLALGIGASLDFIAGRQRRAPKLLQKTGLEWAWRLGTDPRRLAKRYAMDAACLVRLGLRQARLARSASHTTAPAPSTPERWQGSLTGKGLPGLPPPAADKEHHTLDLAGITAVDSAGLAFLIACHQACAAAGGKLSLVNASPILRRAFALFQLDEVLTLANSPEEADAAYRNWRASKAHVLSPPGSDPLRLALHSPLERANFAAVRMQLEQMLEDCAALDSVGVDLDFTHVPFLDSHAIGHLHRLRQDFAARGKHLRLVGMGEPLRKILRLTRMESVLLEPGATT